MAMRLRERFWYPYLIGVGVAAVGLTWYFYPPLHSTEFLFFGLGGVAAVAHFFYQQHLATAQFFRELFTRFNERYDKLNDDLWRILMTRGTEKINDKDKLILEDYFNLCGEEWFFFKAGYVDKGVWDSWLNGMAQFVCDEEIEKCWRRECGKDSYYDFRVDHVVKKRDMLISTGNLKMLAKDRWQNHKNGSSVDFSADPKQIKLVEG